MMTTLIVGASGATGKKLVEQLVNMGQNVRVIVRPSSKIPDTWEKNNKVSIIKAGISEISLEEMVNYVNGCQGVASCLGHNLTWKGVFGKPRQLVSNAVELLCAAIKECSPGEPVRFVLMNTVGNRNRDLHEPVSILHGLILALIRLLVPPHSDNEKAADFLRLKIGQKNAWIEWAAVRPDTLIDQDEVTAYELYASPVRSAIFNPGKTSRINVGNFMARLLLENDLWAQWKGQMPVIYNKAD
jgi:nucleoside-diphosphate-sugar epimerase